MSEPQHVSTYVQEALAIGGIVDETWGCEWCNKKHDQEFSRTCPACDHERECGELFECEECEEFFLGEECDCKALAFEEGCKIQPTFTVGEDGEPMI